MDTHRKIQDLPVPLKSNPSFRGFKRMENVHRLSTGLGVLLESKYLGIFEELQVPKKTVYIGELVQRDARILPGTHGNSVLFLEDPNSNILQPFTWQKFRAKSFRIKRAFSTPLAIKSLCVIIGKRNDSISKKCIQIHHMKYQIKYSIRFFKKYLYSNLPSFEDLNVNEWRINKCQVKITDYSFSAKPPRIYN